MSELELKQKSLPESSELYNSNSSFNLDDIEELKVGTGSHVFYTDKEGSRWGHIKFVSAKAWIKVDGTFSFKNSAGDTVLDTDGITADAITDGLITAAMTSIAAINPVDGEINYNKVGTNQLDSLAVTEAKIAASAVTAAKTSIAAINPVDGEINSNKVGTAQIVAGAIDSTKVNVASFMSVPSEESLVGYWSFDEGAGTQVKDTSKNTNHGTVAGCTFVDGVSGKGLSFTGSVSDYVSLGYGAIDGLTDFTFSIWATYSGGATDQRYIISGARTAQTNEVLFGYTASTNLWSSYIAGTNYNFDANADIEDGSFHHIVMKRSGTTASLYIDGVKVSDETVNDTAIDIDSGGLILGQDQDSVGGGFAAVQAWKGYLDEFRIYNKALTEAEIQALYLYINPNAKNVITAQRIAAETITASEISAGAVTASKITSYNFQLSAGTFTNNSPIAGKVAWANCKVVYNGTEYSITNGNCDTTDKHIYWQLASPTVFAVSASLPALGNDDFLVAFNDAGTGKMVWNSTVINGNRITAGSVVASNLAAGTITANEIATGAITADEIAAGAVTAVKLTTYNFLLSAGTFTNNSPSAGYVAWASCKVVYNGTEYTITNGNSNKKHIYWQLASPTVFAGSDTLPALGNDDFLVSFNNSGTNMFVWNSTVINGNRITAGSITASNLAASTITANEIAASTITAAKMNVSTLSAIAADLGTITAGTITGATIQTASTGYRAVMSNNVGYQLYNGTTYLGKMSCSAGGSVIIDSLDNIYFRDQSTELAHLDSTGLVLPNAGGIVISSGGRLRYTDGYLKFDGAAGGNVGLKLEGSFIPNADNSYDLGASDKRWRKGYFEDVQVDDIYINASITSNGTQTGSSVEDDTYGFITAVRTDEGRLKYKYRTFTVKFGVMTSVAGESGWNDAGAV